MVVRTNVLVLGKSGSGKSSLLNYLWGDVIAKAGVGRPVTERSIGDKLGIYASEPIKAGEIELVIFDSWGMEADKADEWYEVISNEARRREESSKIEDWFHTVIYCISAKGARVEEFEIKGVVEPLEKAGHSVMFALTKAGLASDDEKQKVREAIEAACSNHVKIVEVESVSQTLRGGRSTSASGRDELMAAVGDNFVANLQTKLRTKYLEKCEAGGRSWRNRVLSDYDDKASIFKPTAMTLNAVSENAVRWLDETLASLEQWRSQTDSQAVAFYRVFGGVMLQKAGMTPAGFLQRRKLLSRDHIEWGIAEHLTSVVMHLIPGYSFVRKALHRGLLSDKLDEVARTVRQQAERDLLKGRELSQRTTELEALEAKLAYAIECLNEATEE
jgi:energy-coupling factor transporter ATP-binding protein EcfA2